MFTRILNRPPRERGFTLVELMVVCIIIGIIAAIALPIYANVQKKALGQGVESDVRAVVNNVNKYLLTNPGATVAELSNGSNVPIQTSNSKTTIQIFSCSNGKTDGSDPNPSGWVVAGYNSGLSNPGNGSCSGDEVLYNPDLGDNNSRSNYIIGPSYPPMN